MPIMQQITPCLWFDNQAEEAAKFYTGIFKPGFAGTQIQYEVLVQVVAKLPLASAYLNSE